MGGGCWAGFALGVCVCVAFLRLTSWPPQLKLSVKARCIAEGIVAITGLVLGGVASCDDASCLYAVLVVVLLRFLMLLNDRHRPSTFVPRPNLKEYQKSRIEEVEHVEQRCGLSRCVDLSLRAGRASGTTGRRAGKKCSSTLSPFPATSRGFP